MRAYFSPLPPQGADLPIWIGATAEPALRACGTHRRGLPLHAVPMPPPCANGCASWARRRPRPGGPCPRSRLALQRRLQRASARVLRSSSGTPDEMVAAVRAYADAGTEHLALDFGETDPDAAAKAIERFDREVVVSAVGPTATPGGASQAVAAQSASGPARHAIRGRGAWSATFPGVNGDEARHATQRRRRPGRTLTGRHGHAAASTAEESMKFGRFDDERREYVITRPDTPLPWINYLGSEDYLGLISNTAGGYSFYRDARLRRLTRYRYNNAPLDVGGRYVYVRDDESRRLLEPQLAAGRRRGRGLRVPPRPGLHHHRLAHRRHPHRDHLLRAARRDARGLAHAHHQRARTPRPPVALQRHRVVPLGRQRRRHQLPAQLLHRRGGGRGRRHLSQDRVPGTPRPLRLLRLLRAAGRLRHRSATTSWAPIAAGTSPLVVERGAPRDSMAHGWQPIGSHHVRLELAPGETREVIFVLGYAENPADAKFDPPGSQTIAKARRRADDREVPPARRGRRRPSPTSRRTGPSCSAGLQVETPNEHLDRMVNVWNAYQCMVTFNLSRSASMFESGIGRGMGFRDSNQDLLGFVHMIPERARAAHPRHQRHPAPDRRCLPPVPAADQARQ